MEQSGDYRKSYSGKKGNDTAKNLGRILRKERRNRRISQCRLSNLADLNNSYYCSIEQGVVNLSVVKLLSICESLDVPVSQIMNDLYELNRKTTMNDDKGDNNKNDKTDTRNMYI